MTNTNIKNLPENRTYFTEIGYSQQYPWIEIDRSASGKTVTLVKVDVRTDPDWKPEMISGGFAAHCTNQSQQTWMFSGINFNQTKKIRLTKKGWASKGTKFVEGRAVEFYDYNF